MWDEVDEDGEDELEDIDQVQLRGSDILESGSGVPSMGIGQSSDNPVYSVYRGEVGSRRPDPNAPMFYSTWPPVGAGPSAAMQFPVIQRGGLSWVGGDERAVSSSLSYDCIRIISP